MNKFPIKTAYAFARENKLETEATTIRQMQITWQRSYKTGVKRGYIAYLFQQNKLLDKFIEEHWEEGLQDSGKKHLKFIEKLREDYDDYLNNDNGGDDDDDSDIPSTEMGTILENHLRDFLSNNNLDKIEPGLKLYNHDGVTGREFPIDGGRIDILAIDKDNKPVVIELKVSRGKEKVLGQILCYMGWVDNNLGMGRCRGIVIANEISPALQLGASRVSDIQLMRYNMTFTVEPVIVT